MPVPDLNSSRDRCCHRCDLWWPEHTSTVVDGRPVCLPCLRAERGRFGTLIAVMVHDHGGDEAAADVCVAVAAKARATSRAIGGVRADEYERLAVTLRATGAAREIAAGILDGFVGTVAEFRVAVERLAAG